MIQKYLAVEGACHAEAARESRSLGSGDAASRAPANDAIQMQRTTFARIQEAVLLDVEFVHRGI
jgi:hypothetical protein